MKLSLTALISYELHSGHNVLAWPRPPIGQNYGEMIFTKTKIVTSCPIQCDRKKLKLLIPMGIKTK